MKKLIFILMAAAAMSCGDGTNRSSERDDDELNNDADRTEQAESDTATNGGIRSDTTTMYDRDRETEANDNTNSGRRDTSGTNNPRNSRTKSSRRDSIR